MMPFDNPRKQLKSIKPQCIICIKEQYVFSVNGRQAISPRQN